MTRTKQPVLFSETDIMHDIMIEVSKTPARVFRQNVGTAWAGEAQHIRSAGVVQVRPGDVVVRNARPLKAGLCEGSSDLIGVTPVTIRPEHVGMRLGVFTAIEVKTAKGRVSPAQDNFITQITALGGLAAVCRDAKDAIAVIARLN